MIFGLTYQFVFPPIAAVAKLGNVVMPDLWNINSFLFILLFALITLILFYLIDRAGWQRADKINNQ